MFCCLFYRRALSVIEKYFKDLLQDQEFISTPERLKNFLKLIPDETLRSQVERALQKMPESSTERWDTFVNIYETYCREVSKRRSDF